MNVHRQLFVQSSQGSATSESRLPGNDPTSVTGFAEGLAAKSRCSLPSQSDLDAVQSAILDLVTGYYPPLFLEVIERAYAAKHGNPLPYQRFRCPNALEFFKRHLHHLFNFEWSEAGDCILCVRDPDAVKTREKPPDPTGPIGSEGCFQDARSKDDSELALRRRPVRKNFRDYLIEFMSHYPSGVPLHEFLDDFNRLSGSALDFARYGYNSVIEMIIDLPDVFRSLDDLDGKFILFPVHGSAPPRKGRQQNRYRLDNRSRSTRDNK